MTPEQYCFDKAVQAGSAFYYSLLKLPKSQQAAIAAIAALDLEINEILFECHDPALAYTKFNWWRSEIAKLSLGQPTHPVAIVLQQVCKNFTISPQYFMDMVDGVEQGVEVSHFTTFEDLTIHIMRTVGARELAISAVTSQEQPVTTETVLQLALTLALVDKIQNLNRYVRHGIACFADNELQLFDVTDTQLQALKTTPEIQKLLAYQAYKAEVAYTKVLAGLSSAMRKQHINLLIRCEIALAALRVIRSSQFKVLENWIDITPLRRWWIAAVAYPRHAMGFGNRFPHAT